MGVYLIAQNSDSDQPFLTRMMDKYAEAEEKRTKRNDLHVRMIEQAGEDRVLFMNAKPQEYVDMRFPEYVLPLLAARDQVRQRVANTSWLGDLAVLFFPVREHRVRTVLTTAYRIMNNGSPYNVPAGSQVPMTAVIEKYKQIANEDNERKLEALANDEIKGEQPFSKNHLRKSPYTV